MNTAYAIIIPLQNEAAVIDSTLDELQAKIPENCVVAAGLNGCIDDTVAICRKRGIIVGETELSGYGWGCRAAIDGVERVCQPGAYLFFAGDGANDPDDIPHMIDAIDAYENGESLFIIGIRKFRLSSWIAEFGRVLPNLILGVWCAAQGGSFFTTSVQCV